MRIRIDTHLRAYLEETNFRTRSRRNGTVGARNTVLVDILADAEAAGETMRYLDARGRVAWKATPKLRDHLADLKADAESDADDEAV